MFAIDRYPDRMIFYVDGTPYLTTDCTAWYTSNSAGKPKGYCAPFDRPFCFGVNVALGPSWLGPINPSILPQSLTLDYVRVLQLVAAPRPPASPPPPPYLNNLIWSDEFNGNSLDLNTWSFDVGDACDLWACGAHTSSVYLYNKSLCK